MIVLLGIELLWSAQSAPWNSLNWIISPRAVSSTGPIRTLFRDVFQELTEMASFTAGRIKRFLPFKIIVSRTPYRWPYTPEASSSDRAARRGLPARSCVLKYDRRNGDRFIFEWVRCVPGAHCAVLPGAT